jgi:tetratricopeptide (TPR) repeat protein
MKLTLAALVVFGAAAPAQTVRVWQDTLTLPAYEEGQPDVNPPFDLFATTRFNYPYTLRNSLTNKRVERHFRAVFVENEYLKCSILPDIGGHLYSCTDKVNGKEMFYANPSIKKALIGYRGAWAAFGIEFNFPVSHNWVSMSPVDFATHTYPDGSASVTVGNIDRPYGMQWRVELLLRPASTVLEQRVTLYNRSDVRRRYYWWSNAGVEVEDASVIHYPMERSASHGFTFIDTWPVNQAGLNVSIVRNHTAGPVSQFVHGSREPFMGVWHPKAGSGVVHYSDYGNLPAKKIWSFGVDADGLEWRKTLSDNNSGYVEVQAGLFRNQETYAFLQAQQVLRFTEYWMPVRGIGGISRANLHGVVHLMRESGGLKVGLNVNHAIADAHLRVLEGQRVVLDVRESLTPDKTFSKELKPAPAGPVTFELSGADGPVLLIHKEGGYDWTPNIKPGPQPKVGRENSALEKGEDQEVNGDLTGAWETYQTALKQVPDDFGLNRAAGRLAVTLKRYEEAVPLLLRAQRYVSNDPEIHYYLGIVYAAQGQTRLAKTEWEGAQRQPMLRPAARLQLARLSAREGQRDEALRMLREAQADVPGMVRAGGLEVALLRATGRAAEARQRLAYWRGVDPTYALLRVESNALGQPDEKLWAHLGADPERVLEVAVEYLELGLYPDALALLERQYPAPGELETEPGAALPQDYPLVAYYRGYAKELSGGDGKADYAAASKMSTRYVFPYRATTLAVLRRALAAQPNDATAHFLLGSLMMSGGMADGAIAEWRKARSLNAAIPVLHRNLGSVLLVAKRDEAGALEAFREGLKVDRTNIELYTGASQALSLLGRPPAERAAVLTAYPDQKTLPRALAFDLALSLAEAGRAEDARNVIRDRFFAREEGGTSVQDVYVEVELLNAAAMVQAGRVAEAKALVATLGKPTAGFEFTKEGMARFVQSARFLFVAGQVQSAPELWKRAAAMRGPYAVLAAKALNQPDWKSRAEQLLKNEEPGVGRGLLLQALGREAEAREQFRSALREADHRMSHFVARRALLAGVK